MSSITQPALTPEEVVSAEAISSLKLSADGSRVVYCVGPHYRSGDHSSSALWLADTSTANSARKLTSGDAHDHSPYFHPTSSDIYFLSDRHKAGDLARIYRLPADAMIDSEPEAITPEDGIQAISSFLISPDGNFIAFLSPRESRPRDPGAKESITVWREKTDLNALYLLDLRDEKKTIRTLISKDVHVVGFSWSPDSSSIIYRFTSHSDLEGMRREPIIEVVISIQPDAHARVSFTHVRMPGSATVWRQCGDLMFLQNTTPSVDFSSRSLWTRSLSDTAPTHLAYGEANEALDILDLGASRYAIVVAIGLDTRIDVFDASHSPFTVYESSDALSDLDIKQVGDHYVFVVVRSSGISGEPPEVWSGMTAHGKKGAACQKLSSHNTWLSPKKTPVSRPFYWNSSDGQDIQGVLSHPRGVELKKLPTVIVPHGGPTTRDILDLSFQDWSWRHFLASRGYLVFSPNYRGSTGRGDTFVKAANGGMGTLDWEDIYTMIDEGISQGLIDPDRVAMAGYSQGGFLTAWGCTRPNNVFKAGVIGAGVSDWGFLAASSDLPDTEAALGGGAPWVPGEPVYLRGSPIKDCKNVRAPLLLLHGKDDTRIPLSQSIALLRGVEREASDTTKPKLVIYPREGHIFQERDHAKDVLRRLAEHVDMYLQ